MLPVKEVCVETFQDAVLAEAAGATRLELCGDLSCGGITPSFEMIRTTIEKLQIPVMVMIRPRGGNFNYSDDEFELMRSDVVQCQRIGVVGVVFGILNNDNSIDIERTTELLNLARPMQVTFHKAIDKAKDIYLAVSQLKNMGIDRILSSGGKETAIEGRETLLKMIEIAGNQLKIIVAGKVTWENFDEVRQLIPSDEYHGRKLVKF